MKFRPKSSILIGFETELIQSKSDLLSTGLIDHESLFSPTDGYMELTKVQNISPENVEKIYLEHLNAEGMMEIVLDLTKSQGLNLFDQRSQKNYLDFFGFYASSAVGMNHPKLRQDEEFLERLLDAAVNKITNSDIRTTSMARFLMTFARIAKPDYLPYAFFVSGGALAVENALKAAFDWKVRKNFQKGYDRVVGEQVLHFEESFHGRSGYTLSLTNTSDERKTKHFPKFDWPRISNPKIEFPLEDHLEDLERRENISLEEAKAAFLERKDEIACILIEPIQGEGGDNHFRPEYLQSLKDLAHENDALMIYDEVQTGVAMTGDFWVHQGLGVEPDMMCFGKKTQVCGFLAGTKLDEVDEHVFREGSRINSTWGGNIVDMVRFDRILEIIEEDHLVENAAQVGDYLLERVQSMQVEHECVTNARGRGLFCAADLPNVAFRDSVLSQCYDEGLIMLGCGQRSIRFRTPLTVTIDEIDKGLDILNGVISAVENQ